MDDPIYEPAVYNLHGDYTKTSTIVLSRESYNQLYVKSYQFKSVLEHFRERYVLLFIGISLDDEYIQQVLGVGKQKLKAILPVGFKAIKFVNGEIQIYTGE